MYYFEGRQSSTKQQVELPVVNHRECKMKFRELGITLNDDQLCAGGVWGYDTCDGGKAFRNGENKNLKPNFAHFR